MATSSGANPPIGVRRVGMKTLWRIVGIGMVVAVLASMTLGMVNAQDGPVKGTADKVDSGDTARREKDGEKPFDRSKALWGTSGSGINRTIISASVS